MTLKPEWLTPPQASMREISDPTCFADLNRSIAADLASRGIAAHEVLRLRWTALAVPGRPRSGHIVEALLRPADFQARAPVLAEAGWLNLDDCLHPLENDTGRYLYAESFDPRHIADPSARERAFLAWLDLLVALPGLDPRPFRLIRSAAALTAWHPPGLPQAEDIPLEAKPRLAPDGRYEVDCTMSHGDHLFRVTLAGCPGQPPDMINAKPIAALPPPRVGFGPHGWRVLQHGHKEASDGQ